MKTNNHRDIANAIRNIKSQLGVIQNAIDKEPVDFNQEQFDVDDAEAMAFYAKNKLEKMLDEQLKEEFLTSPH